MNTDRLQGGHEKRNKFRKQKPKAQVSEMDRLGVMTVAGRTVEGWRVGVGVEGREKGGGVVDRGSLLQVLYFILFFVATKVLSREAYFCRDKHVFATKLCLP